MRRRAVCARRRSSFKAARMDRRDERLKQVTGALQQQRGADAAQAAAAASRGDGSRRAACACGESSRPQGRCALRGTFLERHWRAASVLRCVPWALHMLATSGIDPGCWRWWGWRAGPHQPSARRSDVRARRSRHTQLSLPRKSSPSSCRALPRAPAPSSQCSSAKMT